MPYCCIVTSMHIHQHNISRNIVNNNDDFNGWRNTLLYKNIPLILYSRKGWRWLCVRGELETGTDCYILTQSSSDHSSTFFRILAWLLNRWSLRAQSLPSGAGSHSGIFSLTDSNCNWNLNSLKPSVVPSYIIVYRLPTSCGRTHLPTSPNSTRSTGQGDIPISSTGCTCFAVSPLIYTGASLDWQLGRGSVCYNHPILVFFKIPHVAFFFTSVSIILTHTFYK